MDHVQRRGADEFPAATGEPDVPTISFMGRVDPLKDLHTLIRAFALVREEIPEARLRIFGARRRSTGLPRAASGSIEELGLTARRAWRAGSATRCDAPTTRAASSR